MSAPAIGFIGFGEAAASIAAGLGEAGIETVSAYDVLQEDPKTRRTVEARAAEAGATLAPSLSGLIENAGIVVSAVTSAVALDVAEAARPHLGPRHLYVDINSTSPEVKIEVGRTVEASGARFVEAAVMAAVPPLKHRVPMLLSGPAAPELIEALAPYGMDLEDFGPELGRAAAAKMFRSVVVKGMEALLQECVLAADRYDVAERVLESVGKGYPGIDWGELASYLLGRTVIHGERRYHEMEEVAKTLKSLGIQPLMAEAAAKRIKWGAGLGLREAFDGKTPQSYLDILAAIREKEGRE